MRSWRQSLAGFANARGTAGQEGTRAETVAPKPSIRPLRSPDREQPWNDADARPDNAHSWTEQELRRRRIAQRLRQEQDVFDQIRKQDWEAFRLWRAMAWGSFAMVIATVIVGLVLDPLALTGLAPLGALSAWNWRQLLRRKPRHLEPTTTPPGNEPDRSTPSE